MAAWGRLRKEFPNAVVLFAFEDFTALPQACAATGAQVFRDARGETARRYNALWRPRAYALDERGVLTYVQSDTTPDAHPPSQVRSLWREAQREPPLTIDH